MDCTQQCPCPLAPTRLSLWRQLMAWTITFLHAHSDEHTSKASGHLCISASLHVICACVQARQQSVEEVNQRWAAKSHTLLSRIAKLEQQLQGQGQGQGQGQSATSPTSGFQVRHKPPLHQFLIQLYLSLSDNSVQHLGLRLMGCSF